MKKTKKEVLKGLQEDVFGASPKAQAVAINALDDKYIKNTFYILVNAKQTDFLRYLSIHSLVILVRHFFKNRFTESENKWVSELKLITALPKFVKVWERVQYDDPTDAFSVIPKKLLQKTFASKLSKITIPEEYSNMGTIIQEGTFARKMLERGLVADEQDKILSQDELKKYVALVRSIGKERDRNWIVKLLEVLPCSQKLNFLYGNHFSDIQVQKIMCVIQAEEYHISDERNNPVPLILGFLTYDIDMISGAYDYQEQVEELVSRAMEKLVRDFVQFAQKTGPSQRLSTVLDFFRKVSYRNEGYIITELPIKIIKDLFTNNQCLWMRRYLSADQKIALTGKGSADAADVVMLLSDKVTQTKGVSSQVAKKVANLSLRGKMQVLATSPY